jgi:hypothetical protein
MRLAIARHRISVRANAMSAELNMPGAFSHFTIADCAVAQVDFSASPDPATRITGYSLRMFKEFVDLGAVSPDCPFLDLGDSNAKGWANAMHYWHTADFLKFGVRYFSGVRITQQDTGKMKALAWLFGYAAHVVADLVIHPVIKASGYDYAESELNHRQCELQQDVFIFSQKKHVNPDQVEYMDVLRQGCATLGSRGQLELEVANLWTHCLESISPPAILPNGSSGPSGPPDPAKWFRRYTKLMDTFVEDRGSLPFVLRPFADMAQLVVPKLPDATSPFVKGLKGTVSGPIDYEPLVDIAVSLVLNKWRELAAAISAGDPGLLTLANANLDNGRQDDTQTPFFIV